MINADFNVLYFVFSALGLMMAIVMMFMRLSYAPTVEGMGTWATGQFMASVGVMLLALRGAVPVELSDLGSIALVTAGFSLLHIALQLFFGLRPSYRVWLGAMTVMVLVVAWFAFVVPDYKVRRLVFFPVAAGILLSMARLIWRQGGRAFSSRFLEWMLTLTAIVLLLRLAAVWFSASATDLQNLTHTQILIVAVYPVMLVTFSLGFLLMASAKMHDEMAHVASHDSLTNALIRRTFLAACDQELERCRRHGRNMVLLMLDIDHFKVVNDTHGHQMGDCVLVDFVNRISPLLRRSDQLGRFGGEEFVVLLPETSQEEALVVAERIRVRVAEHAQDLPPVTVSIGMTSNRPDEGEIDVLLARADKALYKAKEAGRNRIVVV